MDGQETAGSTGDRTGGDGGVALLALLALVAGLVGVLQLGAGLAGPAAVSLAAAAVLVAVALLRSRRLRG